MSWILAGLAVVISEVLRSLWRRIRLLLSRFGLRKSPGWIFVQGKTETAISKSATEDDFYK